MLLQSQINALCHITHELLTPLTIISVTLNEIKSIAPQISDYYSIMDNNINRLKRLLQQILEFRKAESGNLKLKVSQGNIASFIRKSVDSFLPLLRNKKMQLDISIEQEEIIGYFDPDKVDKILYNLSNITEKGKQYASMCLMALQKEKLLYLLATTEKGSPKRIFLNCLIAFMKEIIASIILQDME